MASSNETIIDVNSSDTRMELAIAELKRNPAISQRQLAKEYNVPRSTLQARIHGRKSAKTYHEESQRLSVIEERALIGWIEQMTEWGWPPRIQHLESMAKNLLNAKGDSEPLGHCWYQNFLKRHPDFKCKHSRNLDQVRKDAGNVDIIKDWYQLYSTTRTKYGIADGDVYNMDEKGFAMGIADSSKVLVKVTEAEAFNVHSGNRDWVSMIECVSSLGSVLPAYFIFQGVRVQQAWLGPIKDNRTTLQVSPNGWTTNEIALHWLKEVFDLHTRHTQGVYRLLILDGHESHVSIDFMTYCEQHKIIPLCLPPHSTHLLQPLDVGVFSPLAKAYKKRVANHSRYGAVNVSKIDFLSYIQEARKEAMTIINISSAWRGAGLVPFDPNYVLAKVSRSKPFPRDINAISTPKTIKKIRETSETLLQNITPSLRGPVEQLKIIALNAIADKTILTQSNQELIDKQKTRRTKQSRKGCEKA